MRLLSELKAKGFAPKVIFDVGASTGIWSETVSRVFPGARYHLFEPLAEREPLYRDALAERLERLPNLTLHPVALGAQEGSADFYLTHDVYSSSALDRGDWPEVQAAVREKLRLPVRPLDTVVAEENLPGPELLKLDCQGSELAILQGAARCLESCRLILAETWLTREYGPDTPLLGELIEWLHAREFALIGFGELFYDSQHRLYSVDSFFMAEELIETLWPDTGGARVRRRVLADHGVPREPGS